MDLGYFFCEDEWQSYENVREDCPEGIIIEVDGGWLVFECGEDYELWLNRI